MTFGGQHLLGILMCILAGLIAGTSPWPLKRMRTFKYEHYGFITGLFAWFIVPWVILLGCRFSAVNALWLLDWKILLKGNAFSTCLGIASILCLLCYERIGVALTVGIIGGLGAAVSVITPMMCKASGIFASAPGIASRAGMIVLFGVATIVGGITLATLAGFGRERLEKTKEKAGGKSGGFAVGLLMVIASGVLSAGWPFAFAYTHEPIVAAMKACGSGDFAARVAVWAFVLFGTTLVTTLYPVYLMSKNRSWGVLLKGAPEIGLAVAYSVQFFASFLLLGEGMIRLGALGASVGSGITQGMMIVGAAILGFSAGEWRGVTGKPRAQIIAAIAVLIMAVLIMAYGNL